MRIATVIGVVLTATVAWGAQVHLECVAGDPVASGAALQAAVSGLAPGDTLVLGDGVYSVDEPLVLTPAHNGTEDAPTTIAAAGGAEVVIRGSRGVSGWEPWRDGIFVTDLAEQGLAGVRFHQLFLNGERQHLARYPNFDPEHPRTGGFTYVWEKAPNARRAFIYGEDDLPLDRWDDISQAKVQTVFGRGWNFAYVPITEIDRENRIIQTEQVRRPYERMNRYFICNVLGALDAPGEWFLDYETDRLYFMPPDGEAPADGEVTVPATDSVIEVRGELPYPHEYLHTRFDGGRADASPPEDAPEPDPVQHVALRGLTVEEARQDAIILTGARDCAVIGCTVRNAGNVGVNLGAVANAEPEVGNPRVTEPTGFSGGVGGGGQNILFNDPCMDTRVIGCDVFDCGADGIFLYGDRNVAENNHVRNTGLYDKDCACINLWGEANVARRNTLHDVPRNAVFLKGIDQIVELNELRWTMLETCDGGAIRMCQRNLELRGNVIRHNRILDTVGYGYPGGRYTFQSPYYSWGVYLDDFTCGTTVEGNIIARVGRSGVMVHGGSDNALRGNIVVNAPMAGLENAPIREHPVTGNLFVENVISHDIENALIYRSTKWVGGVDFMRNLAWSHDHPAMVSLGPGGGMFETWDAWMAEGLDEGSIIAPPQFVAPEDDDYRLQDGSPAWELGFEAILREEIGAYRADSRASWPVDIDQGVVREEPVLAHQPTRPINEDFELEQAGQRPRNGDIVAPGTESSIRVTEETAASGEHSLKFVDAPELRQVWLPRIYYGANLRDGQARLAFDLRLSSEAPPRLYVDPRQYTDSGGAEYFSGPKLDVRPDGSLIAGGQEIAKLPHDRWISLEMILTLGEGAPDATPLTITVAGEEPVTVQVPHGSEDFERLERVVFASIEDQHAVFYVDNIVIGAVEE